MPFTAVRLVVPCSVPGPAAHVALAWVLLSALPLAEFRTLPNRSSIWMAGCWAKATPTAALAEGWVWRARLLAAPATSRKAPKLEAGETPARLAVPLQARLPIARGVPVLGRTRTF